MHIGWLNSDQGCEPVCVLDDDLRDQPRIGLGIVRIDENPPATMLLTPFSDIHNVLQVTLSRCSTNLRARGEGLQARNTRSIVLHV